MTSLALVLLAAIPPDLVLTTGWVTPLDVPEARRVLSEDPKVVRAEVLGDGQVLLFGGAPGQAVVTVIAGAPEQTRSFDYLVKVTRFGTLTPKKLEGVSHLSVDQPRTVSIPDLRRVALGDESICAANPVGPGELELLPKRAGAISLLVWSGGEDAAHRKELVLQIDSGGFRRTVDEDDSVLTEPYDGRVVLVAGEQAVIDRREAKRFAVRDGEVARILFARGGELVLEGAHAGRTRMLLWGESSAPTSVFLVVEPRSEWVDDSGDPEPPKPPTTTPVQVGR